MVGEGNEEKAFIFTHARLDIGYRDDRVLEVNLTSENPRPIVEDQPIDFSYEVSPKVSVEQQPAFCSSARFPVAPRV